MSRTHNVVFFFLYILGCSTLLACLPDKTLPANDTSQATDSTADDTAPDDSDQKDSGTNPIITDQDGDGYDAKAVGGDDCDDTDPATYPGAAEQCDEVDNNCDGEIDDTVPDSTYYVDADADGYGDVATTITDCKQPAGYVANNNDCDDVNPNINPTADEVCDGVDNDCDGKIDANAVDAQTWYRDSDRDTYGDASTSSVDCDQPSGYVDNNTDCDDSDWKTYPDADERCDEVDNDCDGTIDEDAVDGTPMYVDNDADGYGTGSLISVCSSYGGYADIGGDCDDLNDAVYPDADDYCDHIDNNCADGEADAIDLTECFEDVDTDGVGGDYYGDYCFCSDEGLVDTYGDADDSDPDAS